jgi:hypothetical protein
MIFNHVSNQSDDGALKKLIADLEIDEDYSEKQQKLKRIGVKGMPLLDCLPLLGREGVTLTDS